MSTTKKPTRRASAKASDDVAEKVEAAEERTAPKMIAVICKRANGTFPLANPTYQVSIDPTTGAAQSRETSPGKTLQFNRGEAMISEDDLEILKEFNLIGGEQGPIWLASDMDAERLGIKQGAPIVSDQMQSLNAVRRAQAQPPHPDWDDAGADEIADILKTGEVPALKSAMDYELGHKARPEVMRAVADAMSESAVGEESLSATVG